MVWRYGCRFDNSGQERWCQKCASSRADTRRNTGVNTADHWYGKATNGAYMFESDAADTATNLITAKPVSNAAVLGSGGAVRHVIARSSAGEVLTGRIDYWQALTGSTTLSEKFLMEAGSSDTLFTNALALTVKMSDKLALSV